MAIRIDYAAKKTLSARTVNARIGQIDKLHILVMDNAVLKQASSQGSKRSA